MSTSIDVERSCMSKFMKHEIVGWRQSPKWLLYIFKQASACQPPTREICCIGPGIVDSWEKELYIMLDIMYIYMYI